MKPPPPPALPAVHGTVSGQADAPTAPATPAQVVGGFIPAHQWAVDELRRLTLQWRSHVAGARAGERPEELHQLRVATRRIDATLALFKHQLPAALQRLRRPTKRLLRVLGAVRDLDVQLSELNQYRAALTAYEQPVLAPLQERLEQERGAARTLMLRELDGGSARTWIESLERASEEAVPPTSAPHSALAVLPEQVRRRYRKLRAAVRTLESGASMDNCHEVRRRAKRLRYAVECGAPLFGKAAADVLKALRRLQDESGRHQDAHMAQTRLAALAVDATGPLPAETLFQMGRLAERHARSTRRAGRTLQRAWERLRSRRWKALRQRLDELQAAHELIIGAAEAVQPAATPPAQPPSSGTAERAESPQPVTH